MGHSEARIIDAQGNERSVMFVADPDPQDETGCVEHLIFGNAVLKKDETLEILTTVTIETVTIE